MVNFFRSAAPTGKPKGTKPSVLGWMFVPRFDSGIRPMGQILGVFINMIAMVFAMNGLFPKDHPALKGETGARLTLREIMVTAWSGLSFTQQGLPKVLLFFAVALGIVLSILSIVTAIMLGFVTQAHAQSTVFTLPATAGSGPSAQTDLALNWIDYLFNPSATAQTTAIGNIAQVTGQSMPTSAVQSALASVLGLYSNAILIIAAFILFYHLAAMVVETAQYGVPMGKRASQIWAPIRLVVAIGLLVPVSTAGLNSGQYIVIQITKWGSALASNVWTQFVGQMSHYTKLPPPVPASDLTGMVYDLSMMYACEYDYNYQVAVTQAQNFDLAFENINGASWTGPGFTPRAPGNTVSAPTTPGKHSFTNLVPGGYDVCGSYSIPTIPTVSNPALAPVAAAIYTTAINAFVQANTYAQSIGQGIQYIPGFFASSTSLTGRLTPFYVTPPAGYSPANAIQTNVTALQNSLETNLNSAISSNAGVLNNVLTTLTQQSTSEGWVAAGAWFNTLTNIESEINGVFQQSIPKTSLPWVGFGGGPTADSVHKKGGGTIGGGILDWTDMPISESGYETVSKDLRNFSDTILKGNPLSLVNSNNGYTPPTPNLGDLEDIKTQVTQGRDPLNVIFNIVEWIAESKGIWSNTGTATTTNGIQMGVQFGADDPLMAMAAFGQRNIQAATDMFNIGIDMAAIALGTGAVGTVASKLPVVGAIGGFADVLAQFGGMIAGFILFLGVLFLTLGITMAYIIPLLPFMHFFLNTITWITCVAEAIIAIPLVALAHLSIEGEGLPGQAKGSYQMIFSLFLRPVLMVFGLICSLLVLYVAAGLLNALYAAAVAGTSTAAATGVAQGSHLALSRIMFSIMYVVFMYTVANHAFELISLFPNKAMEWMGAKGLQGQRMGDPGHFAAATSVATGYLGNTVVQQIQTTVQGSRQMISSTSDHYDKAAAAEGQKQAAQGVGPSGWLAGSKIGRAAHRAAVTEEVHRQELLEAMQGRFSGGVNSETGASTQTETPKQVADVDPNNPAPHDLPPDPNVPPKEVD